MNHAIAIQEESFEHDDSSPLFRLGVCSALFLFAAMRIVGQEQTNETLAGAQQFAQNCAGCHGGDGRGGDKAPSIATMPTVVALSDADLVKIVHDGTAAGMPSFSQIGDANIRAVVEYLRTLQNKTRANGAAEPAYTSIGANAGPIDIKQSDLLQKPVKDNWVSYNGDYTGRRYSALSEVTQANASHLQAKWVFHVQTGGNLEVTPVVAAGVMFVTSQNDAYALDAETGNELWHHARPITAGLIDDTGAHHNRGVAVLGNRVYMETDNAHLLCLDARSGNLIWDVFYAPGNKNYGATSAPLIVKNKVLAGTSGGDDGVRGFLVALDAETGKEMWRFWTIPAPGEFGSESWPGDAYLHGGGTTWMPGTYDPELNTLYWGTGNPGPDYDDSKRPGDDLYTGCVLALDPDTGKLKWYFQYNPHNMYDYDAVQTPVLVDANFKGQPRKLLVAANKNGFLYFLDRTNGKYLFSRKFSFNLNWAKGIDENGRPILSKLTADDKGITVCPSAAGGSSWYSPSYNPATNMFYFRSQESCSVIKSKPQPFEEGHMYYGTVEDGPPGEIVKSYVNAFSLDNLDFAWREPQAGTDYIWSGVISTATGLVAYASQQQFIVLDGRNGATLWHFNMGQVVHASPMSYGINGKQYFAIAAGSDVFAFGLP